MASNYIVSEASSRLLKFHYISFLYFSHWRSAWWWRSLCLPAEETGEGSEIFWLWRLPDGQAGRQTGPGSYPSAGPAHWRGAPHPRQCPSQEEFHHSRWSSLLSPRLQYWNCEIFPGTNTAGAPPGHPVGQPLPNPAMARLLWSTWVLRNMSHRELIIIFYSLQVCAVLGIRLKINQENPQSHNSISFVKKVFMSEIFWT